MLYDGLKKTLSEADRALCIVKSS